MTLSKTDSWKRKFQCVLLNISQDLTSDDVDEMKFILTPDLGQGELENIKKGKDLFLLMQKRNKLSYQNTQELVCLLKDIHREDLASKLREFQKTSVPCNIRKEKLVGHFKKTAALADLERLVANNTVVTISGPLGAGKTQTAIAFSIEFQKKNSDCIVWHCNAKDNVSLLTSLRALTDKLPIQTSDADDDDAISLIGNLLQDHTHQRGANQPCHLIILDDVNSESTKSVHNLVNIFSTPENPDVKLLITTRNKTFLTEYGKLELMGFTKDESFDFLIQTHDDEDIEEERKHQYRKIAEELGNLPLGLYIVRTYMDNMHISPGNFFELLMKIENIEDIESQLGEMDLQPTEIQLFTAMKFCIYEDLKKNMQPQIFEMFQMTQFLEKEEIPICLLEFIYREDGYNDKSKTMMMSNFLVQSLQKRSLGTIEGEDDNRRLSIHNATILTLKLCTSKEEKRSLLKKLLWGFSLLFDKDVFMKQDRSRMELLTPHARAFLRYAEKMELIKDFDMLVLMTFVYDVVGFGYDFRHFKTISNEYSEKCKECCFRIMECDEAAIDDSLKKACDMYDENSVEFYEALAKKKSEVLWKKLDDKATSNQAILRDMVPRFIIQRVRTQSNMQDLSKRLNVMCDFVINGHTYETLVSKELALPFGCMSSYFLHELVLAAFYTYGRQLFYLRRKDVTDCKIARRFTSYLFLSKEIGQKLSEKQEKLPPLNALLSEISGVLQSQVKDDAQLYPNKMEVLQQTAERAKVLSSQALRYHMFGIFKEDTSKSNHFQNNCLKLAIQCFTTILQLETDTKTKMELYDKGCKLADEVLERAKHLGDRINIPSYKVSVADFYISIENIPSEHLSRAEKLFKDVLPNQLLEKESRKTSLEMYELEAGYGLVKCYELSDRQEDADNLKSKLRDSGIYN